MKVHILEGTTAGHGWLIFACGRRARGDATSERVGRAMLRQLGHTVTCEPCRRRYAKELAKVTL